MTHKQEIKHPDGKTSFHIDTDFGYWEGDPGHPEDEVLVESLKKLLVGKRVIDFGCGNGYYVKQLQGIASSITGVDGNPITEELTKGLCSQANLATPQNFGVFDWVLSFEVGEHIPKQYEEIFLDNLCNHANDGIIMSWAYPGQPGEGHINCQSSEYIIEQLYEREFLIDMTASEYLRQNCREWWFKSNLLMFYSIKDK